MTSVEQNGFTVSAVYDFSTAGPGTFILEPVSSFQVIEADGTVETISDTSVDSGRSVSITITDDVSKRELDLEKRVASNCADGYTQLKIAYGYAEAKSLASRAAAYLDSHRSGDPTYKDYFGPNPIQSVIDNFNAVANDNSVKAMNCKSDPNELCKGNRVLYVTPKDEIYYCDHYTNLSTGDMLCKGTTVDADNILGGYTLHALLTIHSIAENVNGRYGCDQAKDLADRDKIKNTRNYAVSTQTHRSSSRARMLT